MTRVERTKPPEAHKKESTRYVQKGIAIARFSKLGLAISDDKFHNLLEIVNLNPLNTVTD